MKILFVSAWFPYPPDNGSRIRVYNLIKAISKKHEVYLVSLLQEDSCRENAEYLSDICEIVSLHESRWFNPGTIKSLAGFLSSKPRSYIDTYDPRVKQAVRDAIDRVQPDVIVVSQIGAMVYIPDYCSVNVLFEELEVSALHRQVCNLNGIKRFRRRLTLIKQIRLTKAMLNRSSMFTCVTDDELRLIEDCYKPKISGAVIPNGVDIHHYQPASRNPQLDSLLYNGALTYGANLDAVRFYASEVYPVISSTYPDIKLRVTGRTAGVDLSGITDCPGIELTGYVDDIRTELSAAIACVIPLREGGGSRLKILEAMAAGVPVVSTSMGIEGITAVSGEHALVADSPSDFAKAVEQVLIDPAIAHKLSVNGRHLVEEQYSWQSIGENFVNIIERVANCSTQEIVPNNSPFEGGAGGC